MSSTADLQAKKSQDSSAILIDFTFLLEFLQEAALCLQRLLISHDDNMAKSPAVQRRANFTLGPEDVSGERRVRSDRAIYIAHCPSCQKALADAGRMLSSM